MILIVGKSTLAKAIAQSTNNCVIIGRPEYDIASKDSCDQILKDYPNPDVVINTAGVIDKDYWNSIIVNFVAPSYLTMKYVERLDQVQIINISSASAWWPSYPELNFTRFSYNISKHNLTVFSQHINRICVDRPGNIRITTIEPGKFESPMSKFTGKKIDSIVKIIQFAIDNQIEQISTIK
jgi:NAD(P)-dependent dehydrogenase (short-subunit alcohol dehydrogenase family)